MIEGLKPPPELPDLEIFRAYAARREAERLKHEAELLRLREEAERIARKQAQLDSMDTMAGVHLDEYGMLAPPPPPTPPYAMSESSAESDSSLTDLLRHSQATRDSIEGPYDEGELLNFEYPHRAQAMERLPMEGDVKRPARETRKEIEQKIRRHEEKRARREKGVNKNLFMIRRTDMYRMYRPKVENLPKSYLVLPPPLPGQKDGRADRIYNYNRFRDLPPLKEGGPGPGAKKRPPPPASETNRR